MASREEERRLARQKENAHRLARALWDLSGDTYSAGALARILHYVPEQLQEDMQDLLPYLRRLEEEGENDLRNL